MAGFESWGLTLDWGVGWFWVKHAKQAKRTESFVFFLLCLLASWFRLAFDVVASVRVFV